MIAAGETETLEVGDGAALREVSSLELRGLAPNTELLLFDLA